MKMFVHKRSLLTRAHDRVAGGKIHVWRERLLEIRVPREGDLSGDMGVCIFLHMFPTSQHYYSTQQALQHRFRSTSAPRAWTRTHRARPAEDRGHDVGVSQFAGETRVLLVPTRIPPASSLCQPSCSAGPV